MTESNSGPHFLATHLKLKGAENYASWKYHIIDILGSKYLDEFILPDSVPPVARVSPPTTRTRATISPSTIQTEIAAVNPTVGPHTPAQIWKANDFKAKSIITANVLVEPSKIILKAKSASEAWNTLRLKYEGKGLFLRIRYHSEFNNLHLAHCDSLLDFQIQFRELVQNLEEVGLAKTLEDISLQLILGVGDTFPIWTDKQRAKILAGQTPTMDELFEELEDVSRVQELDKVKEQAVTLFGRSQLVTQGRSKTQKQEKAKAKEEITSNSSNKCNGCQKPGHSEKQCWKLHPELLPQKFKDRNAKRRAKTAGLSDPESTKRVQIPVP